MYKNIYYMLITYMMTLKLCCYSGQI